MSKGILGTKVGMSQVFAENGTLVPVTVIQAGPCTVIGTRTPEKEKYAALRLGFGEVKLKEVAKGQTKGLKSLSRPRMNKADIGVFKPKHKKQDLPVLRHLREFRVDPKELEGVKVGDQIKVDMFKKGDLVDVVGTTKGRGFTGVIKRHRMAGFSRTHGTHEYRRHPGAVGQRKTPGKTYPGKRMPGHYGVERVTLQNLQVIEVDLENNLLLLRGGVPGANNGLLIIRPARKVRASAAA